MTDEPAGGRLLRPEETTVEDHVRMIRRGGRGTGRPPRTDELRDPDRAELAAAGWKKPPRETPTPAPPGPSTDELIQSRRLDRQLQILDSELAMTRNSSKVIRVGGHRAVGDITRDIEAVKAEIAEVKAARVPTADEKAAAKAAARGSLASHFRSSRLPMTPRERMQHLLDHGSDEAA